MKKILFACGICAALLLASCSKNDMAEPVPEYLEVNNYNIAGTWQLSEWNGEALGEGTYAYLVLDRSDKTFTTHSNLDSYVNVTKTGRYDLYDEDIIYGIYDYSAGNWSHYYVISALSSDTMTWTATDDPAETRLYTRVDTLPDGLE